LVSRGSIIKVSVSIPTELDGQVRAIVARGKVSSFYAEAIKHYLLYRKQKIALKAGFGIWNDASHPELNNTQDTQAHIRSIREGDTSRLERLANGA
jgi:hypothetical protein